MNFLLLIVQALVSAAGVLVLRANLDGFEFRNSNNSFRDYYPLVIGIFLYGASLLLWLVILSKINVSVAYPLAIGLTLMFTIWGANIYLKETLTLQSAVGIALIALGVAVTASKGF